MELDTGEHAVLDRRDDRTGVVTRVTTRSVVGCTPGLCAK
jgi:hypothetical protein